MAKICLQWPKFGPYHIARLNAAITEFGEHGVSVIGLETSSFDGTNVWGSSSVATDTDLNTLFPGATYEQIKPAEIRNAVFAFLNEKDPDAVAINSYSLPDARACLEWCIDSNRHAILMTDSRMEDTRRNSWREWLKSCLVSQYDSAIVSGQQSRTYVESLGIHSDKIFTRYDVIDNDYFQTSSRNLDRTPQIQGPYFLASSRFVPRKNVVGLLTSYSCYRSQATNPWNLTVLGDGPEKERIEDYISSMGIEGVFLVGSHSYQFLPGFYMGAKVFVHPAIVDQWGLVVNEAMASGLPVLVSSGAGCAVDLVQPGLNGYIFDPDDHLDLVEKMILMSDGTHDLKTMGERSKEIISSWSPGSFAKNLYTAFEINRVRRRPSLVAKIVLQGLNLVSRRVDSFHSIEN